MPPKLSNDLKTLHDVLEDFRLKNLSYDGCSEQEQCNQSAFLEAVSNLTGDRAKTVCLTHDQESEITDALSSTDRTDDTVMVKQLDGRMKLNRLRPFEDRIIIAASLIQLGIKADCSRCINDKCNFRRKTNLSLDEQTETLYRPMDENN